MGFFRRLNRLWELSKEQPPEPGATEPVVTVPTPVAQVEVSARELAIAALTGKPIGAATIVPDDPLDIFPSDDPDGGQTPAESNG